MNAIWNILFTVFFLWLLVMGLDWLSDTGRLITDIPVFHLVLLSIATFRLVRLFTYDHITDYLRDWLGKYPRGTFLGTAGSLLECPWCTGMWFGFLLYVAYAAFPSVTLPVLFILTIAAIATCLQLLMNLVGWSAEEKKRKVEG